MAAGILSKPCKRTCRHIDCAANRKDAAATCRFCGMPIGFEKLMYRSRLSGDLAHSACLEDAVERNDARVGLF